MYEADGFRNNLELLNDCVELEMQERQEREALIQAYGAWCAEEEGLANEGLGGGAGPSPE